MSVPFGCPNPPPFGFPSVEHKKVVAAFDGGRITSNGGVMLLGAVERQLGIADTLAPLMGSIRISGVAATVGRGAVPQSAG